MISGMLTRRISILLAAAVAAALVGAAVAFGDTELRKSVFGSSGTTSTSASYAAAGTAGQPAPVGISTSASFEVQAGVWYGAGPAMLACGSAAQAADPDADQLANASEGTEGTDPCDADTDDDNCGDGKEVGVDEVFGGQRDPLDLWDFYDVTSDASIDLSDTLAVLARFGLLVGDVGYDPLFDRYIPNATFYWRTAPATGQHLGIDLGDALANLQSFGHSCAVSP